MSSSYRGGLTLLLLAGAAALSPFPSQPLAALILGIAALWLEAGGLDLDRERSSRFSPAVPVYLALSMSPGLGGGLAALFLLLDALYRMESGRPLAHLAQRIPLAAALLLSAALQQLPSLHPALLYGLCPAAYLLLHWGLRASFQARTKEERLVQRQLQLRIRPLEFGLAAIAPLLAAGITLYPALALAALPLLACTHLAAENVMLTAHDESIAQVLEQLKGAQAKAREVAQQRDKALEEKQLLEGFSKQLAGQPELEVVTSGLLATVLKLIPADNVVLFLGSPPEPFSYRVSLAHQEALQGAALTALREPIVDRAFESKKPALQRSAPEVAERLLRQDVLAAALPLGQAGVLYVGRQSEEKFTQPQLDRLKWLAGKATIALEAAFQTHEEARQRRLQEQTVHRLERQVAWLSRLVQGAEAMASSLENEVLLQRFTAAVGHTVPHQGGQLLLQGRPPVLWGVELRPHPELLQSARQSRRPLTIEDTAASRFGSPGTDMASLVVAPLLASQECLGMLVLASDKKAAFSGEQMDLLFLLCSQAAMAFSHAGLYGQVVEARRQLEASQASLVQSSKLTAIGQMAAGVAHELNSPLGAISLSVGEALNQLDERPQLARRLMDKAQVAVVRSKAIVDRLMAYSRKPQQSLQTISLQALVQDTIEFLAFQLRAAGVTVELQSEEVTQVEGEEQPLQQVITNLILNAAQSMEETPAGGRILGVTLLAQDGAVRMDVSDRGAGISEENLQRIFDPFFTTKPVGRGTGLGLWACQQIVTQHHGALSVVSSPGQGSTFTVVLPVAQPKASS